MTYDYEQNIWETLAGEWKYQEEEARRQLGDEEDMDSRQAPGARTQTEPRDPEDLWRDL